MHAYTVNRPNFISYDRQSGWNWLQPVVKICNRLQKIATVPALLKTEKINTKFMHVCIHIKMGVLLEIIDI